MKKQKQQFTYCFKVGIVTKHMSPTTTKGARIKASANGYSTTVPYDHGKTAHENHARACCALTEVMGWDHNYAGAEVSLGTFAWVAVS